MSASSKRRVVITGMSAISPLGSSLDELWDALSQARSGVGPLKSVPTSHLPTKVAGEASQFQGSIDDFGRVEKDRKKTFRKALKVMCRETQMAVVSAHLALEHAGVNAENHDPERSGAVYGSDYMITEPEEFVEGIRKCSTEDGQFDFSRWGTEGLEQMTPLWMLKYLPNMPGSHIAIFNDLRGPSNSITIREASSNLAVGEAYHTIVRGSADLMVAGATGTRIHPMKAVHAAQTEQLAAGEGDPAKASRPFDAGRTGMVLGEGAGTIVLEELETAVARGATILAEVAGACSSIVADKNLLARRDQALVNAIRGALRDAGCSPEEIGHVHAHGLSTQSCDIDEAKALGEIFGDRPVPVVAAKSNFGNLGAGSGLVELIASVLALGHERLFPILNYEQPDKECPIAAVTDADTPAGDSFLNLNVTPQGQAAVVLVKRFAA